MVSEILNHVDFEKANVLLEGFNKSTGFVTAILDLDGNILSKSGWRQICTEFHRKNSETALNCVISDTILSNKMRDGETYHFYQCRNGLIDVCLPIVIRGEHIANLFSGQFFFEEPDVSFFQWQAKTYGFDERAYLEALEKVPVVSKEKVEIAMDFLLEITQLIIEMTADKMDLSESQVQLKENLKDLLESQERYKYLFENSGVGIGYYTKDGIVISYNKKAIENIGGKIEDYVGKSIEVLFPKREADIYFERIEKALSCDQPQEYEDYLVLNTGPKWFSSTFTKVMNSHGEVLGVQIASLDITDRKQAEAELSRVMAQNQRILDNLQDSYFQADLSGNFIVFNPQAVHMYGYSSASELLGQPATMLYADPEERKRVMDALQRDGAVNDFVVKALRKDGITFWVSMNVQFVKDQDDNILGTEGLVRDISERIAMISEIELQRDSLIASNAKLALLLEQSVGSISKICELRDVYTAGHQRRVRDLACALGQQLGLSDNDIKNLSYGALIHDIGKIYIASEILNKPGKISDLEFQIIQTHSEQGYNVIRDVDFPDVIPAMIYQHHERLDGSGYPQGLSGEQIIIESRILAVADVVEAMTSHRPYRPALGIDAALEEISIHKGQKYDCQVVDTCVRLFREEGFNFVA